MLKFGTNGVCRGTLTSQKITALPYRRLINGSQPLSELSVSGAQGKEVQKQWSRSLRCKRAGINARVNAIS
jgi:hypothetical protein